ncbi:hypothetical protein F5Y09DRAFT_323595 [Xylaria sp. FL1042]|nr:hypothetical protein F5Y09DRAFT_323595 [Xylaria sp. FL1042]
MDPVPSDPPSSDTLAASSDAGDGTRHALKKRKAPEEYSTNPNTLRVRARNERLPPYRRAVERAKANDLKAVSAAWKWCTQTESFKEASPTRKREILEEEEKKIMERRRRSGIDADTKIAALNKQYGPGNEAKSSSSGVVSKDKSKGKGPVVPAMARPGYVAHPTQTIPDLMDTVREAPQPRVIQPRVVQCPTAATATATVASMSASTSTVTPVEGKTTQSVPAPPANPVAGHHNSEVNAAIEDLKRQQEAEKLRYKESIEGLQSQINELHVLVRRLAEQIAARQPAHMQTYHYAPAPAPPPPNHIHPPAYPLPPTVTAAQHYHLRYGHGLPGDGYAGGGYTADGYPANGYARNGYPADDYSADGEEPW